MLHSGPTPFPAITIKKCHPLIHSQLCHLNPIGIGTPLVESMTSYLSRVARCHCWSTGTLLTFKVVPLMSKPYMLGNDGGSTLSRIRKSLKAINGVSSVAMDFVNAMKALTLQNGLRFLTLLEWKDMLPARHLLRNVKAWCPDCYQNWYVAREIIYEPLLWAFEAVLVCSKHRRPLITHCPYCCKQPALLDYFSSPGYCSECGALLGNTRNDQVSLIDKFSNDEFKWQLWVTENIGNLLAASITLPRALSGGELHRSLGACIRRFGNGSISKFASLIGKQKTTVWGWQRGKYRPTLLDILRICYQCDCSLLEFIMADEAFLYSSSPIKVSLSASTDVIKKTRKARTLNHAAIKQSLEDLLDIKEVISVTEAARRIACSVRTLYRISPDLCKLISKRYASFVSFRAEERRQKLYLDISQAATKLYTEGINPTGRNISHILNRPEYAFRRDATAALREARHLLN